MKEYLPILERLLYCAAFFMLGWFWKGCTFHPCPVNKVEFVYKKDTVFINTIKTNKELVYKYIRTVDSLKTIVKDTVNDSIKSWVKDQIITYQDTVISNQKYSIDTLEGMNKVLNNQLDSCSIDNAVLNSVVSSNNDQIKKDRRNKTILGGAVVVLTAILSNFIIK